jgi:biopolymer transport protein ExbB
VFLVLVLYLEPRILSGQAPRGAFWLKAILGGETMTNLLQMGKDLAAHGQVLIYLILLCSVISVSIIVDRLISLRKANLIQERFMRKLAPILKRDRIIEAISLCDKYPSIVARAAKAGILKHDRAKEEIQQAMGETSRLEMLLPILESMAYIAPLLGFLGTVLGMIEVFARVQSTVELLGPGDLAQGMAGALLTTAAGLIAAIPSIMAHNYFRSSIDGIKNDVEQSASEIIGVFSKGLAHNGKEAS